MNKKTPMVTLIDTLIELCQKTDGKAVLGINMAINEASRLLPLEEAMMKEVWEVGREYEYAEHFRGVPNPCPDFNQFISQYNKK